MGVYYKSPIKKIRAEKVNSAKANVGPLNVKVRVR